MGFLNGRRALVTGAARGIGRSIAESLAAEGAELALVARGAQGLAELAAVLRAGHSTCAEYPVDLTDFGALRTAFARIEAETGPIDILINNAGIAESAPFTRTTDSLWERTIDINLRAPYLLSRLAANGMADADGDAS